MFASVYRGSVEFDPSHGSTVTIGVAPCDAIAFRVVALGIEFAKLLYHI
jgi:hypothetical protein